MKKPTASFLAGIAGLALTAGAVNAQTILFQETFESATVGEGPHTENWAPWDTSALATHATNEYPDRSLEVVSDPTGSVFGSGPNQFLRVQNGAHYHFGVDLRAAETSVVTLSFDYIPRANTVSGGNRWLNLQFYGEVDGTIFTNPNRLHVTGIQANNQSIRTAGASFASSLDTLTRFDIIFNNSDTQVSHFAGGAEQSISSGEAQVWTNGDTLLATYNDVRILADSIGMNIAGIAFLQDSSTNRSSYDLDNVTIFDGAHVGGVIPEPSTYALIFGGLALAGAGYARRRRA